MREPRGRRRRRSGRRRRGGRSRARAPARNATGGDPPGGTAPGRFDDAREYYPPSESADKLDNDELTELADGLETIGITDDSAGALFGGYELFCAYHSSNAYPRSPQFQAATIHYEPGEVGDHHHAKLVAQLDQKNLRANAKEVRTLVSTISYLIDMREHQRADAKGLAEHVARLGTLPGQLAEIHVRAYASFRQTESIIQHLHERLALIKAIAFGFSTNIALYEPMYENGALVGGTMGTTDRRIHDKITVKKENALESLSARGLRLYKNIIIGIQ